MTRETRRLAKVRGKKESGVEVKGRRSSYGALQCEAAIETLTLKSVFHQSFFHIFEEAKMALTIKVKEPILSKIWMKPNFHNFISMYLRVGVVKGFEGPTTDR